MKKASPAAYRVRAAATRTATKSAKSASAAGVADGSNIAITCSTVLLARCVQAQKTRRAAPAGYAWWRSGSGGGPYRRLLSPPSASRSPSVMR